MPALESRRVRTQPLTVMLASFGARPARTSRTVNWLAIDPDRGFADQPAEALVLRGVHLGELLTAECAGLAAEAGEPRLHVGELQRLLQLGVEPLDDRARRAAGHEQAIPGAHLDALDTRLGEGGYAGELSGPLGGGDRQRTQPPRLDLAHGGGSRVEHH